MSCKMLLDCAELACVNNVINNINDEISFLAIPLHQKCHSKRALLKDSGMEMPTAIQYHTVRQHHDRSQTRAQPMLVRKYVDWNGCDNHAACQVVNRCQTRGESEYSVACRWKSIDDSDLHWLSNPGQMLLEMQNRGIQWPHKNDDWYPLISFFLKYHATLYFHQN